MGPRADEFLVMAAKWRNPRPESAAFAAAILAAMALKTRWPMHRRHSFFAKSAVLAGKSDASGFLPWRAEVRKAEKEPRDLVWSAMLLWTRAISTWLRFWRLPMRGLRPSRLKGLSLATSRGARDGNVRSVATYVAEQKELPRNADFLYCRPNGITDTRSVSRWVAWKEKGLAWAETDLSAKLWSIALGPGTDVRTFAVGSNNRGRIAEARRTRPGIGLLLA